MANAKRMGIGLAVGLLALARVAAANPYSPEGTHAVQVPGTRHVQFTYMYQSGMGSGDMPTALQRDTVVLPGVTWLGPTAVSHNGGSGVMAYEGWQVCDCNVPLGSHTYKVELPGGTPEYMYPAESTVLVTDLAHVEPTPDVAGDPSSHPVDVFVDAGATDVVDEEILPWDEPEPGWPQGADCLAFCVNPPTSETTAETTAETVPVAEVPDVMMPPAEPTADSAMTADVAAGEAATADAATSGDQAVTPWKMDESKCQPTRGAATPGASLALLALAALALARRRA